MKHLVLFVVAIALALLGGYVLVLNAKALTTPVIFLGGALIAGGVALAFPADFGQASTALRRLWKGEGGAP